MILAAAHPFLPDDFQQIFPGVEPWVNTLTTSPLALRLTDFAGEMEVIHIFGLFLLASATIVTSLRLIGVGLVEVPASNIYRNTRWLLGAGVVIAIGSGLLLGLSAPTKLYNNSAFLFKMIAMIAGIVFSYGVMRPTAKADGVVGGSAKVALAAAMLIWLAALAIMVSKIGSNVGSFHLIYAGALIVFLAMSGWRRWAMLAGAAVIIVAWQLATHVFILEGTTEAELARYMAANKLFMWLSAIWVLVWAGLNVFGVSAPKGSTATGRLIGYATILVWVTVAAGGRWIGLT